MTAAMDPPGGRPAPVAIEGHDIPTLDYDKLLALLHGEHSATLHDRHAAAISRVCRAHRAGFPIRDLPHIDRLLRFAYDRVAEGAVAAFEPCLADLMRVFALPFLSHACNDEHRNLTVIASSLALVADAAVAPGVPSSVRVLACDAIRAFAARGVAPSLADAIPDDDALGVAVAGVGAPDPPEMDERNLTNQKLATLGGCAARLVAGLAAANDAGDDAARLATCEALLALSRHDANAADVAAAGFFHHVAPALRGGDFRARIVFVASELMWNVLEAVPARDALKGSAASSRRFREAFANLVAAAVSGGHGDADKELRNELLLVGRMLAGHDETRVGLRAAGLLDTALAVATRPERSPDDDATIHPRARTTLARDFEMKRLAWSLVAELAADEEGARMAHEGGFVACLLAFLEPLAGFPDLTGAASRVARWSPSQLADLQELALRILARLVPTCASRLVLAGACETAAAVAAPTSAADAPRRCAALAFLERAARHPGVAERLGSAGALEAALAVVEGAVSGAVSGAVGEDAAPTLERSDSFGDVRGRTTRAPGFETHAGDASAAVAGLDSAFGRSSLGARGDTGGIHPKVSEDPSRLGALALLAALCDGDERNFRAFRRLDGTATLKAAVDATAATDAAVPISYGAAVLHAVWRCVVPDAKNRARFVAAGGIGSLLDLMTSCRAALRPATLSLLADILENPKTHLFFHEWRSAGTRRSIAPAGTRGVTVVLDVWRAEEERLGLTRGDGVIANPERPLAGWPRLAKPYASRDENAYAMLSRRREETERRFDDAARLDADGMFTRVFAVCSLLGFDNLRRTCGVADAVTLAAVERFVDFKEGEVWEDTRDIFEREGMFPVGPDRQTIDEAIATARASAEELEAAQRDMVEEDRAAAAAEEALYYLRAREQKEGEEAARWYKKDRAKMTMRERLTFQLQRNSMLGNSFKGSRTTGEDGALRSYRSAKKMSLEEADARGASGYGGYDAATSSY